MYLCLFGLLLFLLLLLLLVGVVFVCVGAGRVVLVSLLVLTAVSSSLIASATALAASADPLAPAGSALALAAGVWLVCTGLLGVVVGLVGGVGLLFCLGPTLWAHHCFHTSLSAAIAVSSANVSVMGASSSMFDSMPLSNCTRIAVFTSLSPFKRRMCPNHCSFLCLIAVRMQ